MIDLQLVVSVVLTLIIAGAVFALLMYLIDYVARQFPSEPMNLFAKVAKVILVVLAILLIIGILISLASGRPLVRWGEHHW